MCTCWFPLVVLASNIIFTAGIKWTKYELKPKHNTCGKRYDQDETVFNNRSNVPGPLACGKMCHVEKYCRHFEYDQHNQTCDGYRLAFNSFSLKNGSTEFIEPRYKGVCYFKGSSDYDMDFNWCTHIILTDSHTTVDNGTVEESIDNPAMEEYAKLQKRKTTNPCLKILAHVKTSNGSAFARAEKRQNFAESAVSILDHYGIDGIVIGWDFPNKENEKPEEKQNLVDLTKVVKQKFFVRDFVLAIAVKAFKQNIDNGYDFIQLQKYLDFIDVETYNFGLYMLDYCGSKCINSSTEGMSPLIRNRQGQQNEPDDMKSSAEYMISKGVPRTKIVLGVLLDGREFKLHDVTDTRIGAPATDQGTVSFGVILGWLLRENTTEYWDNEQTSPYLVADGGVWATFENVKSINEKVTWLKEEGYGGVSMKSLLKSLGRFLTSRDRAVHDILTSG